MASLCLSTLPITNTSLSSRPPFFSTTSSSRFKVSCNASPDDTTKLILPMQNNNIDRRNLLMGLGGLYGAANIGSALAYPITAPDNISHCSPVSDGIPNPNDVVRGVGCCLPQSANPPSPKPYTFPKFTSIRVRPAAHRATPEYIAKYQEAIRLMKELPDDDPHSWKSQARIHCAYCNGAYTQEMNDHPELQLQVHNSSLFFPFHRWYLYFYERILGKLINDETFALPYWNWDHPTGMMLPAMFEAPAPKQIKDKITEDPKYNPLFDPFRNVDHLPPSIVDLQVQSGPSGANCVDQVAINLSTMYSQMVGSITTPSDFFGTDPIPDPNNPSTPGKVESGCHTALHIWTGSPRMANGEDMGNFYSAGYDPIFYCHHANVDRMWKIWKNLAPLTNNDPVTDDWLNASYVFYDENKKLVRVYNRDCVDITKMGYDFQPSSIPWRQSRPVPLVKASRIAAKSLGVVKKTEEIEFPLKLDQSVKVLVKRPATKRSEDDKKKAHEMLFMNGIRYNGEQFFKLDVLVNDVGDGIETTAASSEFVGTFAQVPHAPGHDMFMTSGTAFAITGTLEDLEAEDDEYVLVTLVPRAGVGGATVAEIKIQLVPTA